MAVYVEKVTRKRVRNVRVEYVTYGTHVESIKIFDRGQHLSIESLETLRAIRDGITEILDYLEVQ